MKSLNKIVNFKLDKETIQKLMAAPRLKLNVKKDEAPEIVMPDARIKLDGKKSPPTATYFNNKSTNLHFFGDTTSAVATVKHVPVNNEPKRTPADEKTARGIESLDIPSIPNSVNSPIMSPLPPKSTKSTLKKPSTSSSTTKITTTNKKVKSNPNNIPRTPHTETPRPTINEKLSDRVLQSLALKPYQVHTLAKVLDCTQWDVKRIIDDVGFLLPDPLQKKKYCLKPSYYKKIRIWDWPLYTNEEKLIVLENAKEAYQLLHVPEDAIERNNLIDPAAPSPKKPIKKPSTTTKKPVLTEKKQSPELKGKGKTTPSGFSYASPTSEPAAPTPSSKLSPTKPKPPLNRASPQLKPSSSNKKVGSKALPQPIEKTPPPAIKRKLEQVSTKKPKSNHDVPANVELSTISSQSMFEKYCAKFVTSQKDYSQTKLDFKKKHSDYIRVLESTKPPKGSKRSYYDLKSEYYDLVKTNYLKQNDATSWEQAETKLRECNKKRRRLTYMWHSLEKSRLENKFQVK